MNPVLKFYSSLFVILFVANSLVSQNKAIEISGRIVDASKNGIPYAAVSLPSQSIGTATNEEGYFQLSIAMEFLSETLVVSTIGFKSYKTTIQDFVTRASKIIVLEDDVATLDEVTLTEPGFYVKNALKNLKNTTISKPHQLNILYRRFSTEDNKARFFVEHYVKVIDRGPGGIGFDKIQIVEGRKSADYRFIRQKQKNHAIQIMTGCNQLRMGIGIKKI